MKTTSIATIAPFALCALLALAGCATRSLNVVPAAEPSTAAAFEELKSLQGTWMMTAPDGTMMVGSVFSVSSNGSVVREIMFPGEPHEMTNLYHLDGDSIVVTHYCAAGNQPRMRCVEPEKNLFVFQLFEVTNLIENPQTGSIEHMGDLTLTISGPTTIRESWQSYKDGVSTDHAVFDLTRG